LQTGAFPKVFIRFKAQIAKRCCADKSNKPVQYSKYASKLKLLLVVILSVMIVVSPLIHFAFAEKPATFSKPKNLSKDEGFSEFPRIAASGKDVYLVWVGDGNNGWATYFKRSNNYGASFKPTVVLTEQNKSYFYPKVEASGDNVYLAWLTANAEAADPLAITFKASHNHGKTFDPTIDLWNRPPVEPGNFTDPASSTNPPELAADDENVYVAWQNAWNIYIRASHDNGNLFEETQHLVSYHFEDGEVGEEQVGGISIAASGADVYVVWNGRLSGDIFLKASQDGGDTFGPTITLSNNSPPNFSEAPQAIARGANLYVTWVTFGYQSSANFIASTDEGIHFNEPIILGGIQPSSVSFPRLAADGENVYAVWGGLNEAFFRTSHDRGETFDQSLDLNEEDGFVYFPQIVAQDGFVYASWLVEHSFETNDVFVRISQDGGDSFGAPITALDDVHDFELVFAVFAKQIYVAVGGLEVTFAHS